MCVDSKAKERAEQVLTVFTYHIQKKGARTRMSTTTTTIRPPPRFPLRMLLADPEALPTTATAEAGWSTCRPGRVVRRGPSVWLDALKEAYGDPATMRE